MRGKVCVVGAGASGMTSVKALKERGVPFDCFEMGSDVGGLWKYENDNGRSAAYRGLHINTSKKMTEFSDYPMAEDWPHYPHHTQLWRYFDGYCKEFGLRKHITFRTEVEHVEPLGSETPGENGYRVMVRDLDTNERRTEDYRAVMVCNGHHWAPKVPEFPGHFDGAVLHARDYSVPEEFEDNNVLVVGIGNSGVDIATETSYVSRQTFLSTRRSAWILPRFVFGKPSDETLDTPSGAKLPLWAKRTFYHGVLRVVVGNQEAYGIPRPDHKLLSEHPTISTALLERAAHGEVLFKPNIQELRGERVRFVDGSEEAIDAIIYATGYYIKFPFFDEDFVSAEDNRFPLYRRVVHTEHPDLYFIGLFQVTGSAIPITELQARWVAGLLVGELQLPDRPKMLEVMERDWREMQKRYVGSTRHTIQVDYWPYIFELREALENKLDKEPEKDRKPEKQLQTAGTR